MPIFTLRLKSMPSTNSRKPWTKCWRDCSPSETMSMPASSCCLSHSSVASRLARSSSAPEPRHAGHSFFGSASHSGLGRLPAMVVFSIACVPSCRDSETATKSLYANIIRGYNAVFSGREFRGFGRGRGNVLFVRVRHLQSLRGEQGGSRLDVDRRPQRCDPQPLLQAERQLPPLRPHRPRRHAFPGLDRRLLARASRLKPEQFHSGRRHGGFFFCGVECAPRVP